MQPSSACPRCGATGRRVDPATPAALVKETAQARWRGAPLHFCGTASCEVVYYGDASPHVFREADLTVPVFQKSETPDRWVCYCFGHRVAHIESDVQRGGDSDIPAAIAERCRAGLDDCTRKNPQGRCCLGNVRQVLRAARARFAATSLDVAAERSAATDACGCPATATDGADDDEATAPSCCGSEPSGVTPSPEPTHVDR